MAHTEVNLYESEITSFCTISLRGQAGEMLDKLARTEQMLHTAR